MWAALLIHAPLLGFVLAGFLGFGEEIDLLGDDLTAITSLAFTVGPAGVVDPTGDHDHSALGDVLGDAFANAVEASDTVPFSLGLTGTPSACAQCPIGMPPLRLGRGESQIRAAAISRIAEVVQNTWSTARVVASSSAILPSI